MGASRYIHLDDVTIKRETDAAFLIVIEEGEFWIPKSQIADASNYEEGDEGASMSITEWIADQKGIA